VLVFIPLSRFFAEWGRQEHVAATRIWLNDYVVGTRQLLRGATREAPINPSITAFYQRNRRYDARRGELATDRPR
jgi:hypothetical protein